MGLLREHLPSLGGLPLSPEERTLDSGNRIHEPGRAEQEGEGAWFLLAPGVTAPAQDRLSLGLVMRKQETFILVMQTLLLVHASPLKAIPNRCAALSPRKPCPPAALGLADAYVS